MRGFFVGLLGLEPRMTEPKSVVLPLHHRPVPFCDQTTACCTLFAGANVVHNFFIPNFCSKKYEIFETRVLYLKKDFLCITNKSLLTNT